MKTLTQSEWQELRAYTENEASADVDRICELLERLITSVLEIPASSLRLDELTPTQLWMLDAAFSMSSTNLANILSYPENKKAILAELGFEKTLTADARRVQFPESGEWFNAEQKNLN